MRKGVFNGGTAYRQKQSFKQYIRERDKYTCQLCGGYGDQVDHIVPHAVSQDSTVGNMRVLCKPCNLATRRPRYDANLPIEEWYECIKAELATI
jgi:5-methylcytosine-specific restriction endonuclease McrA